VQVWEETGYDMRPRAVNARSHFIQITAASGESRKPIGLYIVPGVDEAFPFEQQCEGEIQSYAWFHVDELAHVHAGLCALAAGAKGAKVRLFQVCAAAAHWSHLLRTEGAATERVLR
jgi:8-oxo-dGTP pyrophosphatase MutT (NUDIX family)